MTALQPDTALLIARREVQLREARAVLADAAHHSDTDIRAACDQLLAHSRDPGDVARANDWLAVLAMDP